MVMSNDAEKVAKEIIDKMSYIMGGINARSTRQDDLIISQALQALSEAYKNLSCLSVDTNLFDCGVGKEAENEIGN